MTASKPAAAHTAGPKTLWIVQCTANMSVAFEVLGPSALMPTCCPACGGKALVEEKRPKDSGARHE